MPNAAKALVMAAPSGDKSSFEIEREDLRPVHQETQAERLSFVTPRSSPPFHRTCVRWWSPMMGVQSSTSGRKQACHRAARPPHGLNRACRGRVDAGVYGRARSGRRW